MISAPVPDHEQQRLESLRRYRILDTEAEAAFDALTSLASSICNTPISVVSLVDADRQWFKSARGLPGVRQTSRDVAFCAHAILSHELMEVPDAQQDARFHDNPLVTSTPNIRFYAGVPLVDSDGFELGTLCVIDTEPKVLNLEQRRALTDLACAAVGLIQARTGENRFREIVEKAPYGIAVIDAQGLIRLPNEPLQRMLGYSAEQLAGQTIASFLKPATRPDAVPPSPLGLDGGPTLTAQHADGREIAVEASFSQLGGDLTAISLVDVSMRNAAALNAQRAKAELKRIIDHMPAMIGYWDGEQNNRFGNWAYREWFDIDPEQMRGRHMRDIIGERLYEQNRVYIEGALAGVPQVFERTIVDAFGKTRQTLASYEPDVQNGKVDGFYAFVNDISPLKEAENARAAAEAQLQSVIDAASEFSIIAVNLDGVITLFSRGSEQMLGYRAEDLIGRETPQILHLAEEVAARGAELSAESGDTVSGMEVFFHRVRRGGIDVGEWTYRRQDGSLLPVSLVVSGVRDAQGELIGFLGIARDSTEQKQYNTALAAARDAAEAASRAKSDFVANMSHEIRTPINAILGMTYLLENAPLNADRRRYTTMIRSAGESLLGILNDILDFSKIEAGKMELERKDFVLDEILGAVASIMTVNVGNKELELCIDVDPAVPAVLLGERLRLQQVLTNLASNAIKFTERGEIVVSVRLIEAKDDCIQLGFEVRDTGIGISQDNQNKLFSAFSQADSSTTRQFGGTGLGLAISRRLVELMGGTIGLDSVPGHGSRFWFTLPLAPAREPAPAARSPRHEPLSVLVADDHPLTLALLHRQLSAWGWEVVGVNSTSLAVRSFMERTQHSTPYDLVILDATLADKAGFAALMNTRGEDSHAPGIILTRNGSSRDAGELEKHDWVNAILIKPFTSSRLMDAVVEARSPVRSGGRRGANTFRKVPPALRLDGVRLLLVEDNPLNQIVGRGILEQAGAQVVIAAHGQQAVDVLKSRPQEFDLVLMDVQMPVLDGFQATRLIREELQLTLPIIAMTAGVMASERDHCLAAGMNDFIAKPIDVEQMLGVLREHLSLATPKPEADPAASLAAPQPAECSDVLDLGSVLGGMENNGEYMAAIRQLMKQLCENGQSMVDGVVSAWDKGNSREAMALLHKMRWGVGTLGALRLSAMTVRIEQAMGEGLRDEVSDLLPSLRQEMQAVLEAAERWLQRGAA